MPGPDRRLAAEKTGKLGIQLSSFPSLTQKGYVFLILSVHLIRRKCTVVVAIAIETADSLYLGEMQSGRGYYSR